MMAMIMHVMLGAGVVKGQRFPPSVHPSVSSNDQRYICTWMHHCLWTDSIVIVKQEGSLLLLTDQQCVLYRCASHYQHTTPCHRNKNRDLWENNFIFCSFCYKSNYVKESNNKRVNIYFKYMQPKTEICLRHK